MNELRDGMRKLSAWMRIRDFDMLAPECPDPQDAADEIERLERENAEQRAAIEELVEGVRQCMMAIDNCDAPPEAFGVGGEGESHWYLRDELLNRISALLDKHGGK